ncbi:hypothetical protein [Planktothrix sp.]|uniref:hypothetical protein n=1 Tax=Planktothrix sp. TaxID=3088171 RepID=UPI0038D3A9C9
MVFRIRTGRSFPVIDNEDYLGIVSLALSNLAKNSIGSTDSEKVKQVLMVYVAKASADWLKNKEKIKEPLLTEVKASIKKSVEWLQKKPVHKWKILKKRG